MQAASTRVGFVGVGQMGRPMVDRLLAAGFPVTALSRRPALTDELTAAGVTVHDGAAAVAAEADVLVVCTFSDAQLREVALDGGALAALRPGATFVTHVTGSPVLVEALAAAAPPGVAVVDAPMSGTDESIRAGTLTLLVGAAAHDLERVRPVLAAYASPIVHVGGVGDGQRIKLVNNLLFTVHVQAAVEAARLGAALGVEPARLAEVLGHCSGASGAVALLTRFPAEVMVAASKPYLAKDVAVVREVAEGMGLDLGLLGDLARWVDQP